MRNGLDFLVLSAIWGSSFLFMQMAAPQFGVMPTAALRVAIASLVLLPLVWHRGLLAALCRHWRATFLVGVFNSGIPFALYAFALAHLSTGLTSILNATTPMFGALVAWIWLRDRPDASRVTGLEIGFVGVALLAGPQDVRYFSAGLTLFLVGMGVVIMMRMRVRAVASLERHEHQAP